jgi:uncharacterized membrane protein HdeD (DUF308 family)
MRHIFPQLNYYKYIFPPTCFRSALQEKYVNISLVLRYFLNISTIHRRMYRFIEVNVQMTFIHLTILFTCLFYFTAVLSWWLKLNIYKQQYFFYFSHIFLIFYLLPVCLNPLMSAVTLSQLKSDSLNEIIKIYMHNVQ